MTHSPPSLGALLERLQAVTRDAQDAAACQGASEVGKGGQPGGAVGWGGRCRAAAVPCRWHQRAPGVVRAVNERLPPPPPPHTRCR